jgi:hypothetical protein
MAKFTKQNASAMGRKGGFMKAQRERNEETARQVLERLLCNMDEHGTSARELIVIELLDMALKGDLQAIKYVFELSGEVPTQRIEVTGKDGKDFNERKRLSKEEILQFMRELDKEI